MKELAQYQTRITEFLHTGVLRAALFITALIVFFVVFRAIHSLVRRWFFVNKGDETRLSREIFQALVADTSSLALLLLAVSFAGEIVLGSVVLHFPTGKIFITAIVLQSAFWGSALIPILTQHYSQIQGSDSAATGAIGIIAFIGRFVVWAAALLLILSNVGVDVTALIAGLGIGGVAIALATQNILGDIFASLSIILDRPFEVGDYIVIDKSGGTVEKIGIKTTRLRSANGEQLIVSNSDLLKSRIQNFKRMNERRINFRFGLAYNTPPEKLRAVPGMVKSIVESFEDARFDRCHLLSLADWSLVFETVYAIKKADFKLYADIQQEISIRILEQFGANEIVFALSPHVIQPGQPR